MPQPPDANISELGDRLAQAAESQRQLFQEMASFARDEASRFASLRLERNGEALDKMQNCHGLPGLIGVQQEWLRAFVEDYLGQQMRFAGAFRSLAHEVATNATETASENIDRMQQQAGEAIHQAGQAADHTGDQMNQMADTADRQMDQMAQDTNTYVQQTQH